MNILRTVTLDRINRRKDKSVSMTFITQTEQSSEQLMELDKQLDQSGVIYFKPQGLLTDAETKELDNVDTVIEGKTQSQRLRNVLYILWEQSDKKEDFNTFYKDKTERIIQQIKDKLK